ncbi:hypothetical protein A20C1_05402 [marine actinobacterium PHSC20C1]|nr:hypothetical protein A20C1_05402 [marine actinobacterium PHSC20C1]
MPVLSNARMRFTVRSLSGGDREGFAGVESTTVSRISENPYAVLVRDLMHRPGEMRELQLQVVVPEAFGNAVIAVPEGSQLKVDARFDSLHDGILAAIEVSGTAKAECVRCLIDVTMPVKVEFQELFAYSEDEAFDYTVIDEYVDLEPVVRDAVVLSLPFQPVCQKDCLGLCPECGVRLLDNPGHEHEAPIDSRWAALSGLQDLTQDSHDANDSPETQEEKS